MTKMINSAPYDQNTLAAVKPGLSVALTEIAEGLEQYFASPDAAGPALEKARGQLRGLSGVLKMADLEGLAIFCKELELGLGEVAINPQQVTAMSKDVLRRSLAGVMQYLDSLANGADNATLNLFAHYQALQQLRGLEMSFKLDLFYPNLAVQLPQQILNVAQHGESSAQLKLLRSQYQQGLMRWLRREDAAAGAQQMQLAVGSAIACVPKNHSRAFWWVAHAFFECVKIEDLPEEVNLHKLLSRIDQQMRAVAEGKSSDVQSVMNEMLYVIASSQAPSEYTDAVKHVYALPCYLPNQAAASLEETESLRNALREQLHDAQESWERCVQGDNACCEKFKTHVDQLVADSGKLDRQTLQSLAKQIQTMATQVTTSEHARPIAIDMSMALLLLGSGIENYSQLDTGFQQQAHLLNERMQAVVDDQPEDMHKLVQLVDLNFQMTQTSVMMPLANEMLANLQRVEEGLNAFFNDQKLRSELNTLLRLLTQIHGGLSISSMLPADQLLATIREQVHQFTQNVDPLQPEKISELADAVGRLENYLQHLAHGQAADVALLKASPIVVQVASPIVAPVIEIAAPAVEPTIEAVIAAPVVEAHAPADFAAPLELTPPEPMVEKPAVIEAVISQPQVQQPAVHAQPLEIAAVISDVAATSAVEMERPIIEDQELLDIFLEEAQEVIGTIHSNIDICRAHPGNHEALVTIRRGFHTFKGSGRMVGLNNLGEVAWNVERALNSWLQKNKPANQGLLDFIEVAVQSFAGWVEELGRLGGVRVEAGALNSAALQLENGLVPTFSAPQAVIHVPEKIAPEPLVTFELMPLAEESVVEHESALEFTPDSIAQPEQIVEQHSEAAAEPAMPIAAELESFSTPQPIVEPAEEVVTIGDKTLPASLFNIASAESMENVALLQEQFDGLRATTPPVVQYDFMRAAHTLVGLNQAMGFACAVDLAHALEIWSRARLGLPTAIHADQFQVLEDAITGLGDMVLSICNLQTPQPRPDMVVKITALEKQAEEVHQTGGLLSSVVLEAFNNPVIPPVQSVESVYAKKVSGRADDEKPQVADEIDTQLLPVFIEEADELCPLISEGLRAWREQPDNQQIAQLFKRQIHTIKGSSRMVGAMRIGEIAHGMEDSVSQAASRSHEAAFWDDLETDFDNIIALLEELKTGKPAVLVGKEAAGAPVEAIQPAAIKVSPDLKNDRRVLDQVGERAAAGNLLRVRSDVVDRLVNDAGEISVARSRIETELRGFKDSLLELTNSVSRLRQQLREVEIHAEGQMQARVTLARDNAEQFDPLEFDRFTRLQELTRFMNESVHDVQTVQQMLLKKLDDTAAVMQGQARLNREMQQRLMSVRMVSFNSITDRLYRIVRQTSKELNKRANLELQGTNVELDRSVLEKMVAPFEHLLRNAIVHGLESVQDRADRGKSPIGEISLSVRQENNEVVFEFSDDGAGLNYVALRSKAMAGGLVHAGEDVSDDQLAQLIFTSGLSTATSITEVAGRGVGMDVVRSEIVGLGGRIDVSSKRGLGTQFHIYLPLTLAVTQIVLVRSGENTYAIPSVMVEQVRQVKSSDMVALHQAQKLEWQGREYQLHYLSQLLSDVEFTPENQPRNPLLLLRSGEQRYALHVDELLGNQEAVVKNIGPQLARHAGIAGATVLGNGAVVMILNPAQLAQRISSGSKASRALAVKQLNILPLIMVVDDSLTVRKITSRMLIRAGYQVVTATDGVDALEQLEEFTPDVMLLDIEMPRMDGFALAKELRRSPNTKNMPIIMITSRTADKHRDYAMQLGVNTYLGKPYQEDELLQNIAEFLAVHK
ncbi:MAG: response regulator [Gallionella sp.]|nr:response regulator [Gallionella sp.]